jgi:transcription antitermination factor NusG
MIVWTLLRLNPQSQGRYIDHVAKTFPDIEVYFPVFTKLSRPARRRHPVVKTQPVYPGYIFAHLDLDMRIRDMLSCPVRARFVKFGQTISVVPPEVITEIKRLEALKLLVREEHRVSPFQPGRRVRVSLPMADITAVVVYLMNKNRAVVDTPLGNVIVPVHKMTLI